jgi:hypothetical protein
MYDKLITLTVNRKTRHETQPLLPVTSFPRWLSPPLTCHSEITLLDTYFEL